MVQNLSDFGFWCGFALENLYKKYGCYCPVFQQRFCFGLLFHVRLFWEHGFLCIPNFFHQFPDFLYISGIDVSCGVHSLYYLLQIAADFPKCVVVLPKLGIINVINVAVKNLMPDKERFAPHAGGLYFLFQYVLLIVTEEIFSSFLRSRFAIFYVLSVMDCWENFTQSSVLLRGCSCKKFPFPMSNWNVWKK